MTVFSFYSKTSKGFFYKTTSALLCMIIMIIMHDYQHDYFIIMKGVVQDWDNPYYRLQSTDNGFFDIFKILNHGVTLYAFLTTRVQTLNQPIGRTLVLLLTH